MREFDVQSQFDSLAGDVARRTAIPDADIPVWVSRRRRRTHIAVAIAAAVTAISVVTTTDVLDRDRAAEPAQPGLEQTEGADQSALTQRLLRWAPGDEHQLYVVDAVSFFGSPGIDDTDANAGDVSAYIKSTVFLFDSQSGPFTDLIGNDLVTYVGDGTHDMFVLDAGTDAVQSRFRSAGWEDAGKGDLTPGSEGASTSLPSRTPRVRIDAIGNGHTLLSVGLGADSVPDVLGKESPPEPSIAAQRLLELGGAVGVALDVEQPCFIAGATLNSPARATALIVPPENVSAQDLSAAQIAELEGVNAVERLRPSGDLVSAELVLEDPGVPAELMLRLGLPGSDFC